MTKKDCDINIILVKSNLLFFEYCHKMKMRMDDWRQDQIINIV